MRHRLLRSLLVLLAGCGSPFSPVVRAPAPRQIPINSTVRIWASTGEWVVHHVGMRHDSLIGQVQMESGPVAETRMAIPLRDIDSLRVIPRQGGQQGGAFLAGFAIGAILILELIVGAITP